MSAARDLAMLAFCWACYRAYLVLPIKSRLAWRVLPWAGQYAYSETWADFRRTCRGGRP